MLCEEDDAQTADRNTERNLVCSARFAVLLLLSAFLPVFFPHAAEQGFGFFVKFPQNSQRFFIIGKQKSKQPDGDGKGDDFFRRNRKPEECQVSGGYGQHPAGLQLCAQPKKNVGPAIGDDPRNTHTKQQPGICNKLYNFLYLFLHYDLLASLSCVYG